MAEKRANIALSIARRANQWSRVTSIPAFTAISIEEKFSFGIKLICPVQSSLQKEICSRLPQNTFRTAPSRPTRGAYRDRHGRGMGCGGRGSAIDEQRLSGRRSRVVLTPRRWCQVGGSDSAGDGGKRARSPGRARSKP